MASQTMLAGMKFSTTGTPNSHVMGKGVKKYVRLVASTVTVLYLLYTVSNINAKYCQLIYPK